MKKIVTIFAIIFTAIVVLSACDSSVFAPTNPKNQSSISQVDTADDSENSSSSAFASISNALSSSSDIDNLKDDVLLVVDFSTNWNVYHDLIDLYNSINSEYYTALAVDADSIPLDLDKYKLIIIADVTISYLTIQRLDSYAKAGGNVLFFISDDHFDYQEDQLPDSFLPIKSNSNRRVIMLCIDASTAMCGGEGSSALGLSGTTGIQLIKTAFIKCLYEGVFNANDYVGMLFFGGKTEPILALPITNAYNILDIENSFNQITQQSNTEWRRPLEVAARELNAVNITADKHILFITEGAGERAEGEASALSGYPTGGWKYYGPTIAQGTQGGKCYTGYLYDTYGIMTSTINVINRLNPAQGYIEKMAVDGGGHYYFTTSAAEIMAAVENFCKLITAKTTGEKGFLLDSSYQAELLISNDDLPKIISTIMKAKDGATAKILLEEDHLFYSYWQNSLGYVGCVMTDISDDQFGLALFDDDEGKILLNDILKLYLS